MALLPPKQPIAIISYSKVIVFPCKYYIFSLKPEQTTFLASIVTIYTSNIHAVINVLGKMQWTKMPVYIPFSNNP